MLLAPPFHWQATLAYMRYVRLDFLERLVSEMTYYMLSGMLNSSHSLTVDNYTNSVCCSCFYHIHALCQIHGAQDNNTAAIVASTLVSACLDYINSILCGTSTEQVARLQCIQNALGRVVAPSRPTGLFSFHLLKQLHWLLWNGALNFKLPHSCLKP